MEYILLDEQYSRKLIISTLAINFEKGFLLKFLNLLRYQIVLSKTYTHQDCEKTTPVLIGFDTFITNY
ncbi:hypothetical protein BpHYR1_032073 [Brachionus plicatilis]|uniref:Uncharacterized protein n=1 Tax=Brachionus plicatilis TaxID=10195 RepID=A0A3M7RR07_BRAPC|nr:hypothetical protein BpHYR1_032073 [Brachionus plicatilis]